MRVRSVRYLTAAIGFAIVAPLSAQSPSEHVAMGDKLHEEMKPAEALVHYQAAANADSTDYEALWKASRDAADLAEFEPDRTRQNQLYAQAEQFARRAIKVNPTDAEGHFYLARAIGKLALTKGVSERVKYGKLVYEEATTALKYNPNHPGALHALGRWNQEIMRLSGFQRFMAKNFLGGGVMNQASWDNAKKYLEKSVEVDPDRLVHHLDLAEVYLDTGDKPKAKEQFQFVIDGKATDYNDQFYKKQAEADIKKTS